jgi:hypothetical protein
VEGLSLGLALTQNLSGAWLGGVAGLGLGSVAGWWLEDHAPNYGRVAVIQSGAFLGAVAGVLAFPALGFGLKYCTNTNTGTGTPCDPNATGNTTYIHRDRVGWSMLAGINLGLAAGLALAYLPDQREYGPSWQRVMLIDLAAVAGGFTGALVQACRGGGFCGNVEIGPKMARYALAGGAVGLAAGFFLTLKYDKRNDSLVRRQPPRGLPIPSALPVQATDGHWALVPGLLSQGHF